MELSRYSISFVFPMFNEADNIAGTVRRAAALAKEICDDYEIIVVDDASTDGSADAAERLASGDPRVKCIRLAKNTRFGGALAAGLKSASKDVVVYTDSDFPAKEEDIKKAIALLADADVVTAYSLVNKDTNPKRVLMSKVYNFLVQRLFGLNIKDINSGLKIYRKKVLEGLELVSKSPFVDVEIFAKASRKGFKIMQYGLIFGHRAKGHSSISRPGIVARTFWDMLVYRFSR